MFYKTRKIVSVLLNKDIAWWRSIVKATVRNPTALAYRFYYIFKRCLFDLVARQGIYKYQHNIIFIAGMPLSATTWVKNMFGRVPGYFTRYTPMPYDVSVRQDFSESAFMFTPKHGYTLFKTHLNPTASNLNILLNNNVKKVIVTQRDFRDAALANYHRIKKFPSLPGAVNYSDITKITKEEALNESIKIASDFFVPWMDGWMDIAKEHKGFVYFCEFEKLRNDPKAEFNKMLDFYEIKISEEKIDTIIEASQGKGTMEDNQSKAVFQTWALSSNFRSGKTGGWKDEFTEKNIKYCEKMLGKDLIRHGYEKDNTWTKMAAKPLS
jgi:hypothetical protein